ncbi:MAG: hypothetical protein IT219_00065 [Bacteroidales bacterium]|nr:hypothetical protein [Bacteroidales bacterium]
MKLQLLTASTDWFAAAIQNQKHAATSHLLLCRAFFGSLKQTARTLKEKQKKYFGYLFFLVA